MPPKFKVGDRVKCKDARDMEAVLTLGQEYTVKQIYDSACSAGDYLVFEEEIACGFARRFELVTTGGYNAPGQGIKHDQGKAQWHLVPLHYLEGMVKVMMAGATKYSPHNWRAGMPHSQPYNALQRHLAAYQSGQDNDPETGLPHLDHALCCLLFLKAFTVDYPDKDDRYVPKS